MRQIIVFLLLATLLALILAQDFPPIEHGKLELGYVSQNINDTYFAQIMEAFDKKVDKTKLEYLLISWRDNLLTKIDTISVLGSYHKLYHLELVFADNNITSLASLSDTLKKLTGLKELILSFGDNKYIMDHSSLAASISHLTGLEQLLLFLGQSNVVQDTHDEYIASIAGMKLLNKLYLGFDYNTISDCASISQLNQLVQMKEFDLSYVFAGIYAAPDVYFIGRYVNLQNLTLNFQNNQIEKLPDLMEIIGLPIKKLIFNFGINQLSDVKEIESFAKLEALEILMLTLNQNDIEDLYPFTYFRHMPKLHTLVLNLQSNQIKTITYLSQLGYNSQLESININLMSNSISNYDAFFSFKNASELRVAIISAGFNTKDNFTYISSFSQLTKLEGINLNNRVCKMSQSYVEVLDQGADWQCNLCSDKCQKCFGPNATECLTCPSSQYYLENQCYAKCPTGYHKDNVNHTCVKNTYVVLSFVLAFSLIIIIILILLCK